MKAVTRRLQQLERRLAPQTQVEAFQSLSVAMVLHERRRRRCEANGEPFEELPLQPISALPGRRRSIAETLRLHRLEAYERNRGALSGAPG